MTAPLASVPVVGEDEQVNAALFKIEELHQPFDGPVDGFSRDAWYDFAAELLEAGSVLSTEVQSLRTQLEAAQEKLSALRVPGDALANIAYNLAQQSGRPLYAPTFVLLDECRRKWDEAVLAARTPTPPERG